MREERDEEADKPNRAQEMLEEMRERREEQRASSGGGSKKSKSKSKSKGGGGGNYPVSTISPEERAERKRELAEAHKTGCWVFACVAFFGCAIFIGIIVAVYVFVIAADE